jgi:hypothetical protein
MKFLNYLTEYKFIKFSVGETWSDVPWIYNSKSGLWYIVDGVVYNNGKKKGKINNPHYDFAWGHADLENNYPELQDYDLCGKVQGHNLAVYNYISEPKKREYMEKKALDAVYKYIPEKKQISEIFTLASELHPKDTVPSLTDDGQYYLFYHGTTDKIARDIISSGMIKKSPGFGSGIATTRKDAYPYASMKAIDTKNKPVILQLEISKKWLDDQRVTREVGGHGINQFLVRNDIPTDAIRVIRAVKR